MRFMTLIENLDYSTTDNISDVLIEGIAYDSRSVERGYLFVAIPGHEYDGHDYITSAIENGAVAVIVERWQKNLSSQIAQIKTDDSRAALAQLSKTYYKDPSSAITLIGVTGTNGKTTTSYLIERIFRGAGKITGLIGTLEYKIAGKSYSTKRTTPESLDLQKILALMVEAGVEVAVMEVSSHASILKRVDGCNFDAFVFTNLTQDHLDFHNNMDDYFAAKARLFNDKQFSEAKHVVNSDDDYGKRLCEGSSSCITYGSDKAIVNSEKIESREQGLKLEVSSPFGILEISTKMQGIINIDNILAAVATAFALGIDKETIKSSLAEAQNVPGRFEHIGLNQEFQVVVDYAHTPDGLRKVLEAARLATDGRLITVFGCGGDRDKEKRPLMGKQAATLSDIAIVTSDNPRSEKPESIIDDIVSGMGDKSETIIIVDRFQAIKDAISRARKGDFVLIAGKGHETGQIFSDKILPFDDRIVAAELLNEVTSGKTKSA